MAEWSHGARRRQSGLLLLSAHRAKGLKFDHVVVLDGAWDRVAAGEDSAASRRLYYLAMTRARHTLALARMAGPHPFHDTLIGSRAVHWREPVALPPATPDLARRYRRLTLRKVFLSFAGYRTPEDPIHGAIAALRPGDELQIEPSAGRWRLRTPDGLTVGRLVNGFEPPTEMRCTAASVHAVATWNRDRSEPPTNRSCAATRGRS